MELLAQDLGGRLVFLVIGGVLTFVANYFARRPRLVIDGCGGGILTIRNHSTFLGFIPITRETVSVVMVQVYDLERKVYFDRPLNWNVPGAPNHRVDIPSGGISSLNVMVQRPGQQGYYLGDRTTTTNDGQTFDNRPPDYTDAHHHFRLDIRNRSGHKFSLEFYIVAQPHNPNEFGIVVPFMTLGWRFSKLRAAASLRYSQPFAQRWSRVRQAFRRDPLRRKP